MKTVTFVADSAADALDQIQRTLGPEAVVLTVRPVPQSSLSRLWQKPRIEVVAHLPERQPAGAASISSLLETIRQLNKDLPPLQPELKAVLESKLIPKIQASQTRTGPWRGGEILERYGLKPVHAQEVVDRLCTLHGPSPPGPLDQEWGLVREVLAGWWKPSPPPAAPGTEVHVFVGGPGVGKTTVLSKWLAQVVLLGERSARVWRLDGRTANTAEGLSVYGEVLGVPVTRAWEASQGLGGADFYFIDLPGVDWRDESALEELQERVAEVGKAEVHLVLSAAYEVSLLLEQIKAFSVLKISDLICTRLDEEPRWGKLWNCVLGSNYGIRFLSAGQNVPGTFQKALPGQLLPEEVA